MIIRKRHTWRDMAAAVLLCAGLASCSQDDIPGNPQGEPLPGGEYPLMLTASVDGIRSRAAGKDAWTDGDEIGVRIGADGAAGRYKLNADGAVKENVTPVYWQNTASATVKAWYPYAAQTNISISDQSNGYAAYDFLTATAENQNYQTSVTLNFEHQMAKVKYILQAGNGITADELATATVSIYGYTQVSFLQGVLSGSGDGWIAPSVSTSATEGEALLVPQNMAGKSFIRVTINGLSHVYTPKAGENVGNLEAGKAYTYTITVSVYDIKVEAVAGGTWSDGGSEAAGILVAEYTAEQEKYGDYLYDDGTTSDGGLRARYSNGIMRWENPKPDPTPGKIVLGNLEAKYTPDDVKPGDYIYDDGTTSDGGLRFRLTDGTLIRESPIPTPLTGEKTVSGIVFWTPSETDLTDTNRKTPASLTDDKIMVAEHPNCIHGLAVAVKDVTYDGTNSIKWQKSSAALSSWQKGNYFTHANKEQFVSIASGTSSDANINRIYGYQNTVLIRAYNEYCTSNNRTGYIVLPVAALDDFASTNPAPAGSTGWFFPSVKELHMLIYKDVDDVRNNNGSETREIVNSSLEKVNGDVISGTGDYWTSVESGSSNAFRIYYNYGWFLSSTMKSNSKKVRAVCAF